MSGLDITVVVPTFGRARLLERCLRSVLAGTRRPKHIVVCDQSRDDRTRQMVEQARAEGAPAVYVRLAAPSASAARNAGIERALPGLVAFIDDDCVASPEWLKALAKAYEVVSRDETVSAVTGSVHPLCGAGGSVAVSSRVSPHRAHYRASRGGLDRGDWAPWDAGTGANILAPRDTLLGLGGFDLALGPGSDARAAEDVDLLYRLARAGTIVYEPAAVVYHPAATRRQRLRSRLLYGRGMGAMLAAHLERGETAARSLTLLYLRHQAAQALRRGLWGPVESLLVLAGAAPPLLGHMLRHGKGRAGLHSETTGSKEGQNRSFGS